MSHQARGTRRERRSGSKLTGSIPEDKEAEYKDPRGTPDNSDDSDASDDSGQSKFSFGGM